MPTERGIKLREAADDQISDLIALLSEQDEGVLILPCPGREKLGDCTVAALTSHTADNYLRIAEFLQANRLTGSREDAERRHRSRSTCRERSSRRRQGWRCLSMTRIRRTRSIERQVPRSSTNSKCARSPRSRSSRISGLPLPHVLDRP